MKQVEIKGVVKYSSRIVVKEKRKATYLKCKSRRTGALSLSFFLIITFDSVCFAALFEMPKLGNCRHYLPQNDL